MKSIRVKEILLLNLQVQQLFQQLSVAVFSNSMESSVDLCRTKHSSHDHTREMLIGSVKKVYQRDDPSGFPLQELQTRETCKAPKGKLEKI